MSPSMEKTPSVTITLWRASELALRFSYKSCISKCLYLFRIDFVSLIPSIMDAWFNVSLIMAS